MNEIDFHFWVFFQVLVDKFLYDLIGFCGAFWCFYSLFDSVTGVVTGAVGGAVNLATKMVSNIGNALTLSDTPEEAEYDFTNILLFNNHIRKKEKLVIKPDTIIVVVHRF